MAAKQHERSLERKCALQVLYQGEMVDERPENLIEEGLLIDETKLLGEYAQELLRGTQEHLNELDAYIDAASDNWALDRMPIVDRSLLRLTTYEMKYVDDVPISVSINEAVNLAKLFGGEDSPRFVNGILGRIALALEDESYG